MESEQIWIQLVAMVLILIVHHVIWLQCLFQVIPVILLLFLVVRWTRQLFLRHLLLLMRWSFFQRGYQVFLWFTLRIALFCANHRFRLSWWSLLQSWLFLLDHLVTRVSSLVAPSSSLFSLFWLFGRWFDVVFGWSHHRLGFVHLRLWLNVLDAVVLLVLR